MRTSLGPLFHRLWLGTGMSNLGDGLVAVGSGLLAARLTDSATLVAGAMIAYQLPQGLAALPGGAIADRVDRRKLMLWMNLLRTLTLAVLVGALALDVVSLPLLYAVLLLLGASEVMVDTTAQSIIPMLVDNERLGAANGRIFGTQVAANNFVGSPLAGWLIAASAAAAFAAPALLYAIAALAILSLKGSYRAERSGPTRLHADIVEGLRYLARHRIIRTIALMAGVMNLGNTAFFSIFVLYAVGDGSWMELSEFGFGLLMTSVAAGALLGALGAECVERLIGRVTMMVSAVVGSTICFAIPVMTAQVPAVAVGLFGAGLTAMLWNVVSTSIRQRMVPSELLGRVNATFRLIGLGTIPLGGLLGGVLGDTLGLLAAFSAAALLQLIALPGFLILRNRAIDEADARAAS